MNKVYVSLCIDDLDALEDPKRSDRVATYDMTPEDRAIVMKIIKKHKGPHKDTVGFPVTVTTIGRLPEDAAE